MSATEELKEHAEHAKHPFDKRVAATMGIVAACLAVVGVFGQMLVTEELLLQQKASDQWAYYQAKSIRRYESDIATDTFKNLNGEASASFSEKYKANTERYAKEGEEIQNEARALENESHLQGAKALRMHIGEIFLEIGIVFASLAILARSHFVWILSILSATVGLVVALSTLLLK